ncbi:PAS domain-containing protein [Bacillus sp. Bva_UNVM-123]|uniref:PAS domain-containing protein n=1 Tax=Bacillus sp. Bva_UNVM-123 TaxID=2829798 RepID=UPI00391F9E1C
MVTDVNGNIEQVNPAFTIVTGYDEDEVIGKNPRILNSGKHGTAFYEEMWQTIKEDGHWQGEIWNRKKNGQVYLEWLSISAIKNDTEEIKNYVAMFSEIKQIS